MTNEEKNPSSTTTTTAKTNNDTTTTSSENHQKIANNEQSNSIKAKHHQQLTATATTPSPPIIKINRSPTKTASSNDDTDDLKSRCSFFRRAIPVMPKSLAIACCIMNILFPGLGTLISSFSVFFCASHRYDTNLKAFLINLLAFFMQLFSAIIIFGWVWSIKYGLLFVHLADKTENIDMEPDLPLFVRRHSSMETNYLTKPRLSVIALAKVNEDEPI